jgi:ABC-type nickel/cobalt efflux system permease component RcnA
MHTAPGAGGLPTLRTVCELRAPIAEPIASASEFAFEDGSYPERIGWREVVVQGDGVAISPADAERGISNRLTSYPADLLSQPPNERAVAVSIAPGGSALPQWSPPDAWPLDGSMATSDSVTAVPGGVGGELVSLIDFAELSLPLALVGLIVAAVAGAGHALSPGHGKTVMAAYLIGSRGGTRQAIVLGGAVTVSHTLGVLLLAAVVLLAGSILPPERLYPILTVVSGATVVVIGALLLAGCVRRSLTSAAHGAHAHHTDDPEGMHRHGWRVHSHRRDPAPDTLPGWRGLAALGVAGGLVPSTSALILLLGAIGAGQALYGVALALAFGIGMAGVLTGIGVALVHGRAWIEGAGPARRPAVQRAAAALPWLTAVVVIVGGLVLTGQTLATTL